MNILERFKGLYENKRELALLELTYLAMVVLSVVIAGVVALVSRVTVMSRSVDVGY